MKNKRIELIILFIIMVILVSTILIDTMKVNLPEMIIMKVNDVEGLMNTLFSVQASISTIGVAIIALLTDVKEKNIYGVSLSKYIMQDKHCIFKYKNIILANLFITLINYFFVSMKLYNISIGLFVISILLISIMIVDTYSIYLGESVFKEEIEKYILETFDYNKVEQLQKEIEISIDTNNTRKQKENLKVLYNLFEKQLKSIRNSEINNTDIIKNIDFIDDIYVDVLNNLMDNENTNRSIFFLKELKKLYVLACGNDRERIIYLNIWDEAEKNFYRSIKSINIEKIEDTNIIYNLHYLLYENMMFKKEGDKYILDKSFNLEYYSSRIYRMIKKNISTTSEDVVRISKSLFNDLISLSGFYNFKEHKDKKKEILYKEILLYTVNLINDFQGRVLKDTFFNQLDYSINQSESYNDFCLAILNYIYYLVAKEPLVNENLKEFTEKLINDNKDNIIRFLYELEDRELDINIIEKVFNKLDRFEIIPENEGKFMIMNFVVEDFFIYYMLHNSWNEDCLYKNLKHILKGDMFSYYSRLFEGSNEKNIIDSYIKFNKLFFDEVVDSEEGSSKINMLRSVIGRLYKEQEIRKSLDFKMPIEKSLHTEEERNKIIEYINDMFINFNTIEERDMELKTDKIFTNVHSILKVSDENIFGFNANKHSEDLFLTILLSILQDKVDISEVNSRDENFLNVFINLIDEYGGNLNAVIERRGNLYNGLDTSRYFEFIKDKIRIKGYINKIYAINTELINLKLNDVVLEFIDYTDDDILNMCKGDGDNYLYNITNNIYIPFKIDELRDYIHRVRKKLIIKASVSYRIKEDIVGCGIDIIKKVD